MPDVDAMSSPLPGMSSSIDGTPSASLSAHGLHAARASMFNSSGVRKSLNAEAASFKSSRNSLSSLPHDEWMQAGTLTKQMTGTGFGPGSTLKSQASFHFPSAAIAPDGNPNAGASKVMDGVRKISPAEQSLRLTLSSVDVSSPPAPKSHGSSWAGKLFKRQPSGSTSRSALVSRISDDNISDFGYVQPFEPRESPRTILARVRGREREAAIRLGGESQVDHTPGESSHESTSSSVALQGLTDSEDGNFGDSPANDDMVAKSSDSSLHTYTSSISDGQYLPSSVVGATDASQQTLVAHTILAEELPVSPNTVTLVQSMKLSPPSTSASAHTPDSNDNLKLAPPQKLGMSSIMEVINQEPAPPAPPNINFSPITELINEEPIVLQRANGLTLAAANAIIYGCVTMAAMRYALNGIGGNVRAADLASDMVLAALIGFIVCAVLHFADGGQLRRVIAWVLQCLDD